MSDRLSIAFPLALLAVLAALTLWLDRSVQPPGGVRDGSQRHDPDYVVDKLRTSRMGPNGEVRHELTADRMIHYPDNDSTVLIAPRLTSYGTSRAPVSIVSRRALVSSNGENVYFEEDVRLTRAAYADKSELMLRTERLHVIPDDNIAKTDQPVTITDANTVVTAVGLELNNETRILKLLSRVRGTYHDPKRNKPGTGEK